MTVFVDFFEVDSFRFDGLLLHSLCEGICSDFELQLGDVSVVFCSDEYLLAMNRQYLSHDYYTDIITFDYTDDDVVSGDLFISVDRVRENADVFNVLFEDELFRVVSHGILHLVGLSDKSEAEEQNMRLEESRFMSLFSNPFV